MNAAIMKASRQRGFSRALMLVLVLAAGGAAATLIITQAGPNGARSSFPAATQPAPPAAAPPADAPATEAPRLRQADRIAEVVAGAIAKAHGAANWQQRAALQTDLKIDIGDATVLEGTLTVETLGRRARLETKDGAIAVFDGEKMWVANASGGGEAPSVGFHLRNWSFIIAAPFRLSAPGTRATDYQTRYMQGGAYDSFKLSGAEAGANVPGGWHRIYAQQRSHLLYAIGNVAISTVSAGGEAGGAKEAAGGGEPRAIVFGDYQLIEGVQLATMWTFHDFADSLGLKGDPIGRGQLTNLRFITIMEDTFTPPQGARETGDGDKS